MLIAYKNLKIRNAELEDAEILCDWWNNGEVMAHAGYPNGLDTNTVEIKKTLMADSDDSRRLIIEIDQVPVGEMSYYNQGNAVAKMGIKICDFTKQGNGYGTAFLKMLIASLFRDFGYTKIILDTNLDNVRAQHVYEKIGFRKVKVNDGAFKDQLGEWQSSVDYELLLADFDVSWMEEAAQFGD